MTKDVELHSSTWRTMKQALTGLTENATISSSGYGNYLNAQAGAYGTGTVSTGFAKRVEELVKISETVQRLIAEKDTDGAVSYSYHDDTSTGQTLQSKLSTLERYAGNVPTYIKDKIDRPFYEAMDKVGAKLEALNIQQYKTTNKVGYKRIESMTDPYGHPVGTKEVVPAEIGIDELYKVDSPYRTALQKSYEEFKKSKDYKDHKLTETEYVQAMHQTRAFEYVSIDDEKSKIEMWRDIALGAGLVVLSIFCPPAGAVAGVALASAEMYSAATGKDWGTGRKLDATERTLRGTFALFDLIPAGKYLGTLAKTGKTAGLTAVKNSLKTTLKEGLEQGVRNLDSFKGILKKTKGLGDNVYHSLSTYRKQITHQLKNSVDEKVLNLSKAAQEGLERAKQFTLEVPTPSLVKEASTGRQMLLFEKTSKSLGDTGLGKSLDNLASKAKHVENTRLDKLRARNAFYGNKVDDVVWDASEELSNLRRKWKVPETDTIAVGKTNVPGLEGKVFEGGSPKVRKEAGLPELDEAFPYRTVRSPFNNPRARNHAEEGIFAQFEAAVQNMDSENVRGTLAMHQSNPSGVCTSCISGITNESAKEGIFLQFSKQYPNLKIVVTSPEKEGIRKVGRLNFIIQNGKYLN